MVGEKNTQEENILIFKELDMFTGGLRKGCLYIIGGRASMGKTAFVINIALNALRQNKNVAFFTLEMQEEEIIIRIIAQEEKISLTKIIQNNLKAEIYSILDSNKDYQKLMPFIKDNWDLDIQSIFSYSKQLKDQNKLNLIIVENLQSLQNKSKIEMSEIIYELKKMSKYFQVPIIVTSHIFLDVDKRKNKRPCASDLFDHSEKKLMGCIEREADTIMLIYRESFYLRKEEPNYETEREKHNDWAKKMDEVYENAEIIIDKNRHGLLGKINLKFENRFLKFSDLNT